MKDTIEQTYSAFIKSTDLLNITKTLPICKTSEDLMKVLYIYTPMRAYKSHKRIYKFLIWCLLRLMFSCVFIIMIHNLSRFPTLYFLFSVKFVLNLIHLFNWHFIIF